VAVIPSKEDVVPGSSQPLHWQLLMGRLADCLKQSKLTNNAMQVRMQSQLAFLTGQGGQCLEFNMSSRKRLDDACMTVRFAVSCHE
jgi:hypothetical protein